MGRRADERTDVLFLNHTADRIGPPIGLLHLQRWLQANRGLRFATVSTAGGELLPQLQELGPTTVLRRGWPPEIVAKGALERVGRDAAARRAAVAGAQHRLRRALRGSPPRLVYVNALAPANVLALRAVRGLCPDAPVLVHVHELAVVLEHDLVPSELRYALESADDLVVPADVVRRRLHDHHGVPEERVAIVPEMVDPPPSPATLAPAVQAVRTELGIGPQDRLVVACGSIDWRKAPDLFLQAAWEQRRRRPDQPVTYAWLGTGSDYHRGHVEFELDRLDLRDHVRFVGVREDPFAWFAAADLMLLPSREDPFPLVCLEAASVGTPIVCFDTGGIVELVEGHGAGVVVPYPDVRAMADTVSALLDDPVARTRAGQAGADAVRSHYLTDVVAPQLTEILDRNLARG